MFFAGGKLGGRGMPLKQIGYERMVEGRPQNPIRCRINLSEQAANGAADLRYQCSNIVVETAQHREFRERLVGQSKRALRVRHSGPLRDDRLTVGVGLGFARMQIGDATHRQTGQIGDQNRFFARTRGNPALYAAGASISSAHAAT